MDLSWLLDPIVTHWPFLSVALILYVVGQGMRRAIPGSKDSRGWRGVFWRTITFHPLVTGAVLGFIRSMPVSAGGEEWSTAPRVLYFMAAGAFSTPQAAYVVKSAVTFVASLGSSVASRLPVVGPMLARRAAATAAAPATPAVSPVRESEMPPENEGEL